MHFYGDDTWLTLYPGIFERQEGVASFYVTDTGVFVVFAQHLRDHF
jgi:hypothetical protein